jgi:hypothetical protein
MTNRDKVISMKHMNNQQTFDTTIISPAKPSMLAGNLPCLPALLARLALKSSTYQITDSLPALSAQHQDLLIDSKHLNAFRSLCGFKPGTKLPATYLQTLAMPLVLSILSNKQFPIRAIGKMHLRNQVSVLENFDLRQPINLTASIGSSFLSSRGLEWNMVFTALVDNQLVWSGSSTYLYNCETGMSRREKPKLIRGDNPQEWLVPNGIGRSYGRISGDCNPIHLSSLTAKLFGFKSAIAHGMWSKTRCIAALEDQLPEAGYSVDVGFHRPLYIPSGVKFYTRQLETGQHFSLFNDKSEKAYLTGLIS